MKHLGYKKHSIKNVIPKWKYLKIDTLYLCIWDLSIYLLYLLSWECLSEQNSIRTENKFQMTRANLSSNFYKLNTEMPSANIWNWHSAQPKTLIFAVILFGILATISRLLTSTSGLLVIPHQAAPTASVSISSSLFPNRW